MTDSCIETYIEFQELLINAEHELQILESQSKALLPMKDTDKLVEMSIRISAHQTYIQNIKNVIKDWGNSLQLLGKTYNLEEYRYFNVLVLKNIPPRKSGLDVKKCYAYNKKFKRDIEIIKKRTK